MKMKKVKKKKFRIEKDVLGEKRVPWDSYYGIFTERARENFGVSGLRIHVEMNKAIVEVKKASAQANMSCGVLDKKIGNAIVKACGEILKGKYDSQFVLNVYQAGAGTPWHMNVNEVVANVALEILGENKGEYKIVNPYDHVNMSQSSNDVMPSATRIASLKLIDEFIEEFEKLLKSLRKKSKEFEGLVKIGRTHYMDAIPITLGREFGAWASDLEKRKEVLEKTKDNLRMVSLGGSGVGTGLNVPDGFDRVIVDYLRKNTGLELEVAENKEEEFEFMSDFLDVSSGLRSIAVDLSKICSDLMFLNSGPMTGIHEIVLPEVQPGSSIMPGKFNPSMAEMMRMVCQQIIGNDSAVREAAEAGNLELNVNVPVISHNLLGSLEIMKNGVKQFNEKCVKSIEANRELLEENFEKSYGIATILNPIIGYEKTAKLVGEAITRKKSIKDIVVERKILDKKEADEVFSRKNFRI